jgi:hypothetical protein
MTNNEIKGSCLCGKVGYSISGNLGIFQYCHCSRCRKFTGSAFAASLFVAPHDFRWQYGEELVGRYEVPQAAHYATQFCKNCGSSLPWLTKSGRAVVVPAGTLDDDPGIRPAQNLFSASAACWYESPGDLPAYEEMPPKK